MSSLISPGPSSNIAFLRHISLAMARAGDLSQAFPSPSNHAREVSGGVSVSRPHPVEDEANVSQYDRVNGRVNIYALPTEARTWILIKEYFQKTGQLLPFVHEESFCATYFEMKRSNFTMARRTWLGLLNIILAMATTLYVEAPASAEKRIEESDVYYQRANGLCDKESRRNISLELGELLLLTYSQCTRSLTPIRQSSIFSSWGNISKAPKSQSRHGLSTGWLSQLPCNWVSTPPRPTNSFHRWSARSGSEYGLDVSCLTGMTFSTPSSDDSQLTCSYSTLSMTFGRPAMIPENYIKCDLPITTLQVVGQTPQPTPLPQMDAMCYTATM